MPLWVSSEYKHIASLRNRHYKRYKTSNNITSLLCYKYFRNKANNLAKKLKNKHIFSSLITKSPKDFWKGIKNILPNKKKFDPSVNTTNVPSPFEFGNFFSSIASNLLSKANLSPIEPTKYQTSNQYPSIFSFSDIIPSQILKFISKLNNSTKRDEIGISCYLLKVSQQIVAPYLADIFTSCIINETFPSCFKIARVIPIFKTGDASLPTNYRPISILPNLSKLFEYLLHDQLTNHLEQNQGALQNE